MKRIIYSIYFIFLIQLFFNQSLLTASTEVKGSIPLSRSIRILPGANFVFPIDNNLVTNITSGDVIAVHSSGETLILKTYRISTSVSPLFSGVISGAGTYNEGSTVNLVATANTGYAFTNWTENGRSVSVNATYSFQATISRTLVANFSKIKTFIIATSVSPSNSGVAAGAGIYNQSSTATLVATANKGYTFVNWTESRTIVSTSPSFSFVVNTSRTLVANFAINNPPSASNLSITGYLYVCKNLTGHYTYSDPEGDPEQASTFRWYRSSTLSLSDTVFIMGATGLTYTLTDADYGKYIYFRVTPKASSGAATGTTVTSSPTLIISKSTPGVSFTTAQNTICQGQSTVIAMTFVGTPPYRLVYTDGSAKHTISVPGNSYALAVSNGGNYKGDTLTDFNSCPITNLPSTINITVNPLPTVKIIGLNSTYFLADGPALLQGTPSGGTFAGDGVVPSANLFYPSIAGIVGSPHPIVYSYTSLTTGCKNTDTVKVNVIIADAFIKVLSANGKYCNYDTAFLVTAGNSSGSTGAFSISGGIGLKDNGNNTATIHPALLQAGNYTINYTYFKNVSLTITQPITIEHFVTPVMLGINQSNYCSNNSRIQLSVSNYTGGTFSGNGVGKNSNNTYYFDPSLATPGRVTINFAYNTAYGCIVSDSITATVLQSPKAQFSIQKNCWKGDSTIFINLTYPVNNVNYWEWHYGDNSAPADKNTSGNFEQKHLYASFGDYSVILIARNTNNCSDTIQGNVHLNDIPVVNFTWKSECYTPNIPVSFNNLTTNNDAIATYKWLVQDAPNATLQFTTKNMQHTYPGVNNYPVKLVVATVNGCKDSITKTVLLRPVYSLKDSSYFNTFEASQDYWYPEISADHWTWGTPMGSTINSAYSGNKALFTSFGSSRKNEQLVVTSPCFDFTNVSKPFIQMWVNSNSSSGHEGAVLQFSVDTVLQWTNVGTSGSGINWYNDNSLTALPGGQTAGWSDNNNGWVQVKNNLDALIGMKYARFRMVYGSSFLSTNKDGFAFDDVFIGKRSKTILLEHFTNIESKDANQSNTDIDSLLQIASGDAIGIEYHTSIAGQDTLTNNQSDVRTLYYGISNIPHCYLDGGIDPQYVYNFSTQKPSINDVYTSTLKDPDYSITINKTLSTQVSGNVIVKALKKITNRKIIIYIAVVEDIKIQLGATVFAFNNVLKTFLPSGGIYVNNDLSQDQEVSISYSWALQNVFNPQKLKLVVFIQDDATKEIYQAKGIDASLIVDVPNLMDGQGNIFDVAVYPNPMKDYATVSFGKEISSGFEMTLYDQTGKMVMQCKILQGTTAIKLDVSNIPAGIYFARIFNGKTGVNKNLKMVIL